MWQRLWWPVALAVALAQAAQAGGLGEPVDEPDTVVGVDTTPPADPPAPARAERLRSEPSERPDGCPVSGSGPAGCDGGR